jgi:hypothetical protein
MLNTTLAAQHFVNLEDSQVGYYTGANLRYYKEYGSKQFEGFTSFPVRRCDPVPIDNIGDLKVFFMSAIEGHEPVLGQGIVIPTPESITEILVVRGIAESSGTRFEAYVGYNPNVYEVKGRNRTKVHQAVLLALQTKNTRHVENKGFPLFSGAQFLTNMMIGAEIKKHLLEPKDWNWNGELFQQHFQAMLPKREGFYIANQMIYFRTSYWTKEENRLKGITYTH